MKSDNYMTTRLFDTSEHELGRDQRFTM